MNTKQTRDVRLKPGFHYPSSWPRFTGRVDGPWTRAHFLTPETWAFTIVRSPMWWHECANKQDSTFWSTKLKAFLPDAPVMPAKSYQTWIIQESPTTPELQLLKLHIYYINYKFKTRAIQKSQWKFFLNCKIHVEFRLAIHGHTVLIKHPTETVFHSINYAIFQPFTEWMKLSLFIVSHRTLYLNNRLTTSGNELSWSWNCSQTATCLGLNNVTAPNETRRPF